MNVNSKMNIGLNPNCKILINECWTKSSYNMPPLKILLCPHNML